MKHGRVGTYTNHKCRCAPCREANSKYVARRRVERLAEDKDPNDPRHGLASFYGNHGCRCELCRLAWNRDFRERQRRKANKQVKNQLEDSHGINSVTKEDQS